MDGKTLLLVLIGGGVAAYLAYTWAKGKGQPAQAPSEGSEAEGPPVAVDQGTDPFGIGGMDWDRLCRVAPNLCSWFRSPLGGSSPDMPPSWQGPALLW